jgi:hypothetical protein
LIHAIINGYAYYFETFNLQYLNSTYHYVRKKMGFKSQARQSKGL